MEILPGAEIAFDRLHLLDADDLRPFGLGGSPNYLLIELPFFGWPLNTADELRRLRELGFTAVLAHPERNSAVQESPQHLAELVQRGRPRAADRRLDHRRLRRRRGALEQDAALRRPRPSDRDRHPPREAAAARRSARRSSRSATPRSPAG